MSSSKNLEYEKTAFLSKSNSAFIEEMYLKFVNNDPTLPESWRKYFNEIGDEADTIINEINGPSWGPSKKVTLSRSDNFENKNEIKDELEIIKSNANSIKAVAMIRSYRQRGHLIARLDPLGLLKSDFLLSLGIYDDWSFEKDFIKKNKIPLHAYDASLNYKFLIKLKIPIIDKVKKIFSYKNFFKGNNIHFRKFIGINNNEEGFCTLSSVLKGLEFKAIFLKIDIEGAEYRILDQLIKYDDRFYGCIIEFHDIDLNLEKIKIFIEKFRLDLIHTHVNNCGPLKDKNSPTQVELTFSYLPNKSDYEFSENFELPHELDTPNHPDLRDDKISFVAPSLYLEANLSTKS